MIMDGPPLGALRFMILGKWCGYFRRDCPGSWCAGGAAPEEGRRVSWGLPIFMIDGQYLTHGAQY
jgi:hypothetical protein